MPLSASVRRFGYSRGLGSKTRAVYGKYRTNRAHQTKKFYILSIKSQVDNRKRLGRGGFNAPVSGWPQGSSGGPTA